MSTDAPHRAAGLCDGEHAVVTPMIGDAIALKGGLFWVNGQPCSTLKLSDNAPSDWWERQNVSLKSYSEQHVRREMEPDHVAAYQMFGSYVHAAAYQTAQSHPLILDVGCGIFPTPSPAFERLDERCQYVGLDPLPHNLDRSYPFVCGRLEDLASLPGFTPRFNLFVFGTSLDHVENLVAVAAAVRQLAAPGALLVCWNGLQEPEKVVCSNAVVVFRKLLSYPFLATAVAAHVGYGLVRLPRLWMRMKARRNAIERGEVLDHHLRWFTEANTREYLSAFGEVIDTVALPYTRHGFATVKISASTS